VNSRKLSKILGAPFDRYTRSPGRHRKWWRIPWRRR